MSVSIEYFVIFGWKIDSKPIGKKYDEVDEYFSEDSVISILYDGMGHKESFVGKVIKIVDGYEGFHEVIKFSEMPSLTAEEKNTIETICETLGISLGDEPPSIYIGTHWS